MKLSEMIRSARYNFVLKVFISPFLLVTSCHSATPRRSCTLRETHTGRGELPFRMRVTSSYHLLYAARRYLAILNQIRTVGFFLFFLLEGRLHELETSQL